MKIFKKKVFNYKPKPAADLLNPPHYRYKKKEKEEGNRRDEYRMARRMKKMNQYDPEVTEEKSFPGITQDKAKTIYKFFNEYKNIHRFSRKPIPEAEMKEFIKRAKEYSDFRTYQEYKFHVQDCSYLKNNFENIRSGYYLPAYLMVEISNPFIYEEDSSSNYMEKEEEEKFDEVDYEYQPYFLYLDQIIRMLPDDYHINLKTMINFPAYDKPTGEKNEEADEHLSDTQHIRGLDDYSSDDEDN